MSWLIATLLFLSGANLLALIIPAGMLLAPLALVLFARHRIQLGIIQIILITCVIIASCIGMLRGKEYSEIGDNLRQLFVISTAAILAATMRERADDIARRYFLIFAFAALVGFAFYTIVPHFVLFERMIGPRNYLIGPSGTIYDQGYQATAFLGPYRFQGLMDEPGSYANICAGVIFYYIMTKKQLRAVTLGITLLMSEGLAGVVSLLVMLIGKWLSQLSLLAKAMLVAVIGIPIALLYTGAVGGGLIQAMGEFIKLRLASGQTRGNQMSELLSHWRELILPSGFSDNAIIRIVPESVTSGYAKTLIAFGIPLTAVLITTLIIALRRLPLRSPLGVLFLTLTISGFSRFGLFDMLIGWFVIFSALRPTVLRSVPFSQPQTALVYT